MFEGEEEEWMRGEDCCRRTYVVEVKCLVVFLVKFADLCYSLREICSHEGNICVQFLTDSLGAPGFPPHGPAYIESPQKPLNMIKVPCLVKSDNHQKL